MSEASATASPDCIRARTSARTLRTGVLHLWLVRTLEAPGPLRARPFSLSEDEEARAARYARPELRARFRIARALTRHIVGQACEIQPEDVSFVTGPHGKPSLLDFPTLAFNASHSHDRVLIGLMETGEQCGADHGLGVDIEAVRSLASCMDIAQRVFEPERVAALAALGGKAREAHFFRHWVEWEARLKARGLGIAAAEEAGLLRTRDDRVVHGSLEAGHGFAAAWASLAPVSAVSLRTCAAALGDGGAALAYAEGPSQHLSLPAAAWRLQ